MRKICLDNSAIEVKTAKDKREVKELWKARRAISRLIDLVPNISAAGVEESFLYCRREDRSRLAMGLRAGGLPG